MSEELATVNLDDAAKRIRDQIKSAFVSSIPDDQWESLISSELKKFMADKTVQNYGKREVIPSEFTALCREAFGEVIRGRFQGQLPDDVTAEVRSAALTWLEVNRDTMVESALRSAFAGAMDAIMKQVGFQIAAKLPDPNRPGYSVDGSWIGP